MVDGRPVLQSLIVPGVQALFFKLYRKREEQVSEECLQLYIFLREKTVDHIALYQMSA
jgi:hypothetical protein